MDNNTQTINTGDAKQDREIAEEIKKGIEAGGLKAEIVSAPGGGLSIVSTLPEFAQQANKAAIAASPGLATAASLEPGAMELGGAEVYRLKQQILEGNFTDLRKLIAKTKSARDWQDEFFMTDVVIANALPGSLDSALAAESNAADLYFLRGSHAASLDIARKAVAHAKPGSDMPACLFRAHVLVWQYTKIFEKDEVKASAYFEKQEVRDELTKAFDVWMNSYKPQRSSIPFLHYPAFWFFKTGDKVRLKQALGFINNIFCSAPWVYEGNAGILYTQALQLVM